MDMKIIVLSEVSRKEKDIYVTIHMQNLIFNNDINELIY